jgi:hypothetical protein
VNSHLIGHGGADYGTYIEGGYHQALNIGISIGINKDDSSEGEDVDHVFCLAYRAIFGVLGNITVTCREEPDEAAAGATEEEDESESEGRGRQRTGFLQPWRRHRRGRHDRHI